MTTHLPIAAASFLLVGFAFVAGAQRGADVRKQFIDLAAKNDSAGIVALWKANPAAALATIDQDLEGALAEIEKAGNQDAKGVKEMHARALLGARAADEAFGRSIFGEYAASYVGWNATQQKEFREGQKLTGVAGKNLKDKAFEDAKKNAQRCVEITTNLGDWWGLSSAYGALAQANEGLGAKEAALQARQMARLIDHDLYFTGKELRETVAMARLLVELERATRARMTIDQGLVLAKELKDAKSEEALKELAAKLK